MSKLHSPGRYSFRYIDQSNRLRAKEKLEEIYPKEKEIIIEEQEMTFKSSRQEVIECLIQTKNMNK